MLLLRVGGAMVRAELLSRSKVVWAGEAQFNTPEDLEEAVSQLAGADGPPTQPRRLRVELAAPLVQVRTLRGLPPVSRAQLRALVAVQSARFFRRNGNALVTDACWTEPAARRSGTALAVGAEERWLDAVIRGARSAGLAIESIRPSELPAGMRLKLLPVAEQRRQRTEALLSARRLAAAAVLTWVAALGVFLVRLRAERAAVDQEIARLAPVSQAVGNARRSLGDLAFVVEGLGAADERRGELLARFTGLASALPDSAVVTRLVIDASGRGSLSALAPRSAELLSVIEGSGAVASPRFDGGVVREMIAEQEWERFTVVFGGESGR
jgi:hypothetical protein